MKTTTKLLQHPPINWIHFSIFFLCFYILSQHAFSQEIGDPGWIYDANKQVSSFFEPKQKEWAKAGVIGGIRNPSNTTLTVLLTDNTATIQNKINQLSNNGGGVLKFPTGRFKITSTLNMKKNVVLEGSKTGKTVFLDRLSSNNNSAIDSEVILFDEIDTGHTVGGIKNIIFRGPFQGNPTINNWTTTKPNANNVMIRLRRSKNIFLDNVRIINSADSPISVFNSPNRGGHHTFRNCIVRGAWNKGVGGQGYFNLSSRYCLVYKCRIAAIRHFAIQQRGAEYNVVYNNIIRQDVNFHNDDLGNNLIEKNTIIINKDIVGSPGNSLRFAVMGPWSRVHSSSRAQNYIYNNTITEYNRAEPRCRKKNIVYTGANGYEPNLQSGNNPFSTTITIGSGKQLYAVKNNRSPKGITDTSLKLGTFNLNIAPNPLLPNKKITLTGNFDPNASKKIALYNLEGKMVFQKEITQTSNRQIELQLPKNLISGVYLISLKIAAKKELQKIIY